ncbi:hypothetical protein DVDV_2139 [Desulfovibrio sp. DV]|nr:hypothetical protein DVDV_2139 [Desulfovibrio sp. DV]
MGFLQPFVFTGALPHIVENDAGARREIPGLREGHIDLLDGWKAHRAGVRDRTPWLGKQTL